MVSSVLQLASRRRLRAFLQPDPFGRFVSVMVYLPRDRYTTDCRLAMQQILLDAFNGTGIRYTARVGDSLLAAVHFTVSTDPANPVRPDLTALTKALRGTIRTWEDRLVAAVVGGGDEDLDTAGALSRYADAFDEGYKETYQVEEAVADLRLLDQLDGPGRPGAEDDPQRATDAGRRLAAQAVRHRGRRHPVPGAAGAADAGRRGAGRAAVRGPPVATAASPGSTISG